ncbi:MAG: cobyric acid synthase [bacterium]|nr:cobyric acid synthase [bacterium]
MTRPIMIQGTGSSVGKSIVCAGLCRIFLQDGLRVAPFKSQNMALNSFVTAEGLEMGRAQVVQAAASGLEPSVKMNPILLKPTGDKDAQVIVNGRVYNNLDAKAYHDYKTKAKPIVEEAYAALAEEFETIVIEGAGSPAEINLRDRDIVNMGMAEIANAPVILVSDIDRGGVFASIVGTLFLLTEEEKKRVKGVIINKFRGDIALLKPGLDMLEDIIKIPVLGVIPYMDLTLEDEDSVTERFHRRKSSNKSIRIDVIRLPYLSNFTDFDVFDLFEDVEVRYVEHAADIDAPDILVLPGSKNCIGDLLYVKHQGIDEKIRELYGSGTPVVGICGGYQMLGDSIEDPYGVEGQPRETAGLGIIPMRTVLEKEKITQQVTGTVLANEGLLAGLSGTRIEGYEIHMGRSLLTGSSEEQGHSSFADTGTGETGIVNGNVLGTYIHGIFDSVEFTRGLLNNIRLGKGLEPLPVPESYREAREGEFNRLAAELRKSLNLEQVYAVLNGETIACA